MTCYPSPGPVERGDRTPAGIEIGIGTFVIVAAIGAAAMLPSSAGDWRLAPVLTALVVIAARAVNLLGLGLVVLIAYFLVDGFLVNRLGQVTWAGAADADRLLMVAGAVAAGLAVAGGRRRRARRPMFVPAQWSTVVVPDDLDALASNEFEKEKVSRG